MSKKTKCTKVTIKPGNSVTVSNSKQDSSVTNGQHYVPKMPEYTERCKCETCLYNKNCQFLATHRRVIIEGCTAYKNSADVVEVKHGKWIVLAEFADKSICTECSICGEEYTYKKGRIGKFVHNCYAKYNYCPNCGAKMDLKEGVNNGNI